MTKENPVTLVTGGSAGIGASISRHLLDAGFRVLNLSRRPSSFSHERLVDVQVDLSSVDETRAAIGALAAEHAITRVVHNAGVIKPALIEDVELADVDYLVRLHIHASILLLQATLPAMKEASFGRFVIISSRAMLGLPTRTGYAATKSGQLGLVRTWAMELGRYGVTVNAVSPGPVVTDMFTDVVPEHSEQATRLADSIPVRRLGHPDDVARAVMFLLAHENSFITGQNLFVCGGSSLGSLAL